MHISVIFSTYNRNEILAKTLNSFLSLDIRNLDWEIIAADNADNTETKRIIERFKDSLPITYLLETKPGKNSALNSALPTAKGELIIFTDDDIIAESDWLIEMWEGAKRWPDYMIFGGRIIANWPSITPSWGKDHPLNMSLFALHDPYDKEKPYEVNHILPYGPNMAIRKKIFDQGYKYNPDVGPTNRITYKMGSETELLKRLMADGFVPVFLPNCIVGHQIRIEQLSATWLNRRNFRIGFYDASPDDRLDHALLSCAPYLWKQIFQVWMKQIFYKICKRRLTSFELQCLVYRIRGKIYAQRHYKGIHNYSFLQKILQCQ